MALSFNDVKGLIQLDNVSPKLYDEVANATALCIANSDEIRDANKSTQLRKYYDEFCMWDQKIKQAPEKYVEYLPLIKMLNAKVAYANGRKLVDKNFVDLMRHCLSQLTDQKESFERCKLFFEAFMGFYKMHKPK
jgi:CRISPR-associated protein Csm2